MFGFLKFFGSKRTSESIALIDVGADSIGGAYLRVNEGELPVLLFIRRVMVEFRQDEPREHAMERALKTLCDTLIREGAPILSRATGSGSVHRVFVSLDAPWQKTSVRTEYFEQDKPFVFTKSFASAALQKVRSELPEKMLIEEHIIGTILNGYETKNPYNKEAHRAEIVVLASLIDESIGKEVRSILQGTFHTRKITLIAGSSLRFQAAQRLFPHERNALILDATYALTTLALLRNGLFVAIVEAASAATTEALWVTAVTDKFVELAKYYPLPRTIFLIAQETMTAALQKALTEAKLGEFWLSDAPPKIVSILASHLNPFVRQTNMSPPDVLLLLMALYAHDHLEE